MQKKSLATVLFCFVLILATACNEDEQVLPTAQNFVKGYFVTDAGTPISGAIVEATDGEGKLISSSTTNELGNFELRNIPENTDNALVSFIKNGTIIKQLKLGTLIKIAATDKSTNILLGGQYDYDAVFAVKVIDDSNSEPIENASVWLSTSDKAKFEATTNSEGYAYLPEIVPGRYFIRIAHNDYITYQESLLLLFPEEMDTVSFDFSLTLTDSSNIGSLDSLDSCCNNSIKIKVINVENKQPLTNTYVRLITGNNMTHSMKISDNNGYVEFTDLCTGIYEIDLPANNEYKLNEKNIVVNCNDYITKELIAEKIVPTKCCDNVLIINYKDENGNPINCGTAKLSEFGYLKTANITNGTAIFNEICTGKYSFKTNIEGCNQYYSVADLNNLNNDMPLHFHCRDSIMKEVTLYKPYDTICCTNSIEITLLNANTNDTIISSSKIFAEFYTPDGKKIVEEFKFLYGGTYYLEGLCEGTYNVYVEQTPECSGISNKTYTLKCNQHIVEIYKVPCN